MDDISLLAGGGAATSLALGLLWYIVGRCDKLQELCGQIEDKLENVDKEFTDKLSAMDQRFSAYKLEATDKYASVSYLKDVEERIVATLTGMATDIKELVSAFHQHIMRDSNK